jgi:hypothetical protein
LQVYLPVGTRSLLYMAILVLHELMQVPGGKSVM